MSLCSLHIYDDVIVFVEWNILIFDLCIIDFFIVYMNNIMHYYCEYYVWMIVLIIWILWMYNDMIMGIWWLFVMMIVDWFWKNIDIDVCNDDCLIWLVFLWCIWVVWMFWWYT